MDGNRSFSLRWTLGAAAAYLAMAAAVTWPLVRGMAVQLPGDLGDPLLNVWTLWWDLARITSLELGGYFDAGIMYPFPGALAMSEHLTGIAILALPVRLFTQNPVVIYNAMYLFSFCFAGAAAFVLARRLTGSTAGAFAAGMIFAFAPYRFGQDGHLQVLSSGFIPLTFVFLVELTEKARVRDALLLGLCFALQAMSNMYFGVFLAIACPIIFAGYGIANAGLGRARVWLLAALAAAVAAVVLWPFITPYLDVRERFGLVRNIDQIASLKLSHFLGARHYHWLYGDLLKAFDLNEGALFPGIAAILLALAGVMYRRAERGTRPAFIVLLVIGLVIDMGPRPHFEVAGMSFTGGGIYRALYDWFPGLSGTRVPFRFHVMPMLALAVLASCGVAAVVSVITRRAAYPVIAALLLFMPVEYFAAVPLAALPQGARPPAVFVKLRDLPPGPVLEFPLDSYAQAWHATIHRKPAFTGFTGIHSPLERAVLRMQAEPAWGLTMPLLESMGIRYIVARRGTAIDSYLAELAQCRAVEPADHERWRVCVEEGLREGPAWPVAIPLEGGATLYEISGRGAWFFDAGRDFCDFSVEAQMKYDLRLSMRVHAAADRPVIARARFVAGVLRLRLGGREVHAADVRFALPPFSAGEERSTARVAVPFGVRFDEACMELDEVVWCAAPERP